MADRVASQSQPLRVLVAHQSTIPHYRVAFYRAVERLRPSWWTFAVVFDPGATRSRRVFGEAVPAESLDFPIEPTTNWTLPLAKDVRYQPFLRRARSYHLVVLEDAFNNLSYPLARLLLPRRVRIAYWGHGRDLRILHPTGIKRRLEERKLRWGRDAAGYFAYTTGVRDFLIDHGVGSERVFVLHNTIDIEEHRRRFESLRQRRDELRAQLGCRNGRLLLYVGRINATKRLDLLAAAMGDLLSQDSSYRLLLVGGGDRDQVARLRAQLPPDAIDYRGFLDEPEVAPLLVASDAFVLPGRVGLAPLTALCYDLTPILIDDPRHSPEIEYFDDSNAVIAPSSTDATGYASAIRALLDDHERWLRLRAAAWPSIRHLTIDAMARNFVAGINTILGDGGPSAA